MGILIEMVDLSSILVDLIPFEVFGKNCIMNQAENRLNLTEINCC